MFTGETDFNMNKSRIFNCDSPVEEGSPWVVELGFAISGLQGLRYIQQDGIKTTPL